MNARKTILVGSLLAGAVPPFDDPLRGVDIEKEHDLIKRKESNLSANKRRMVMARYKRLFHSQTSLPSCSKNKTQQEQTEKTEPNNQCPSV